MNALIKNQKIRFILILFLGLSLPAPGKDSQAESTARLRQDIMAVYKSGGEKSVAEYAQKNDKKISAFFIYDFAFEGMMARKESWLKACVALAEVKKDKFTMAAVLLNTGNYYRLVSKNTEALFYFDRALPVYRELNDSDGQGNILLLKGRIYYLTGDTKKALRLLDKALSFFEETKDPMGKGNVYLNRGTIFIRLGDSSKALSMLEKALFFFKAAFFPRGQSNVYLYAGDIHADKGNYHKALKYYDNALSFFEKEGESQEIANVYQSKGEIYFRTGDNSKALEMYRTALFHLKNANSPINLGYVYLRMGRVYFNTGDNSKALEMYDNALPLLQSAGIPVAIGQLFDSKGDIYYRTGDNGKAMAFYTKALPYFDKVESPQDQANVYLDIGDIYRRTGDSFKALETYKKAIPLYQKSGDFYGLGSLYTSLGDIYYNLGDKQKTLEMYNKAVLLLEKSKAPFGQSNIYSIKEGYFVQNGDISKALEINKKAMVFVKRIDDHSGQGNCLLRKGDLLKETGKYSRAMEAYDRALPLFIKTGNTNNQGIFFFKKGNLYLEMGEIDKASHMFEQSLSLYKKAGDPRNIHDALFLKAKVTAKSGNKKKAGALFEEAINILEKLREKSTLSTMKKSLMEKVFENYRETVLFMLENNLRGKAFKYAESMKARVFLDMIAEGMVRLDKGLSPDIKQKRDDLVTKISLLSKKMHQLAGEKDIEKKKRCQAIKKRYRETKNELDELLIKIRSNNPLYASVRYPKPTTVNQLQEKVLNKEELLVRYLITPKNAFAFLVSTDAFDVVPLHADEKKINRLIAAYLLAIKEKNTTFIKRYGSTLYRQLFKPIEPYIKKNTDVIIIPDGQLATIPFEALATGKRKSGRPEFLIEKIPVKYIQSASLLPVLRNHYRRNDNRQNFIGFGDPVYDYANFSQGKPEQGAHLSSQSRFARSGGTLDRLPRSGEEVHAIARLFENQARESIVYSRDQACEEQAKASNMKNFDFIHFACHGLLNDHFQSLVLSQLPPDKSKEDGYLTLNEIMNCDYNAKLIVLSACQTGTGKLERAEGVTGLTRAVMYAGTPAVVASLWNVDDTATKELMITFYKNMLEKNMTKTEALRQAKIALINSENHRSPYYWSAFVMYGE